MKKEIARLPPASKRLVVNVVIETPRGSRNKYGFDEESGLLKLDKVLPPGMAFPFDFGFVPSTRGGDGDPLDVLVLGEEPVFAGRFLRARLLGVIKARQWEKGGKPERNDRLLAAALLENRPLEMRSLEHVGQRTLDEIEQFFVTYNKLERRRFEVLEVEGANAAWKLVKRLRTRRGGRG